MSVQFTQAGLKYMRGPRVASSHPRLETKPTYVERETFPNDERKAITNTGGGYEHFRTTEEGEEVYASHHRLLAIAWNIAHAETGDPLLSEENREGVIDTSVLDGVDVHHAAPELPIGDESKTLGWDNREATLSHVEHGRHSGMTNAEKRAYARDGQRLRDGAETLDVGETCAECEEAVRATVGGERLCLEHATEKGRESGEEIEIL